MLPIYGHKYFTFPLPEKVEQKKTTNRLTTRGNVGNSCSTIEHEKDDHYDQAGIDDLLPRDGALSGIEMERTRGMVPVTEDKQRLKASTTVLHDEPNGKTIWKSYGTIQNVLHNPKARWMWLLPEATWLWSVRRIEEKESYCCDGVY